MEKSVFVHPWTLKIYQVEGTVLVSVRIFVNKMNTYRLRRWNVRTTTCRVVNCFSNIARVKYSIVTSHLHLHRLNIKNLWCFSNVVVSNIGLCHLTCYSKIITFTASIKTSFRVLRANGAIKTFISLWISAWSQFIHYNVSRIFVHNVT